MKALIQGAIQKYIVLILIVLVISAMVVIFILKERLMQVLGIINPWFDLKVLENSCQDSCASWCLCHLGEGTIEWENFTASSEDIELRCDEVMQELLGEDIGECSCSLV